MSINFDNVSFHRLAIHTVFVKKSGEENSSHEFDEEIINIDSKIADLIKNRLVKSCGKRTKAFSLDIADCSPDSFFGYSTALREASDDTFLSISKKMTLKLAESQRHHRIPGGYVLIIDAVDASGKKLAILIKAEPHDAITRVKDQKKGLQLIDKIFLSPNDKFYKVAAIYHCSETGKSYPNDVYRGLMFDDQFNEGGKLANYFWNRFLGFSLEGNNAIQSRRFYDENYQFFKEKYSDIDKQSSLMDALETYFVHNLDRTVDPIEFRNTYIEDGLKDEYTSDICEQFQHSFLKDRTLIESKLINRSLHFSSDLSLKGPASVVKQIKVVKSKEDIENLELNDEYTILIVQGKPKMK